MYDVSFEATREEHTDAIDYASHWGFLVYQNVLMSLHDAQKAADTAHKVYIKILEQRGVPIDGKTG